MNLTLIRPAEPVIERKEEIKKPDMYAIVLHNDGTTGPAFVQQILVEVFQIESGKAWSLMMHAHDHGKSVVLVTSKEIAETRVSNATPLIQRAEPGRDYVDTVTHCELTFTVEPA